MAVVYTRFVGRRPSKVVYIFVYRKCRTMSVEMYLPEATSVDVYRKCRTMSVETCIHAQKSAQNIYKKRTPAGVRVFTLQHNSCHKQFILYCELAVPAEFLGSVLDAFCAVAVAAAFGDWQAVDENRSCGKWILD